MVRLLTRMDDRALVAIACVALWLLQMQRPLNADVAWLLDAGDRWFDGQRLYIDILELNPPLVFYDMALLSAATWTKPAYLAGVCVAIFVSSILCDRRWIAFAAMTIPSLLPFGQRDHLALIAILPFLAADRRSSPIGLWLFAGIALKPHLLLIPLMGAAWRGRWDPALTTLVLSVVTYAGIIALVHPAYLSDMVPLARATYGGLGGDPDYWFELTLALAVFAMNWRSPIAGALLGAMLSYVLQGKFWYYHLVPALGLAIYLSLSAPKWKGVNAACAMAISIMSVAYFVRAPRPLDPIPADAQRVFFATPHLPMAYPVVFERGVENTSPYPALWPVPGAADRPDFLEQVRKKQVDTILRRCPQYIFTNVRDRIDYFGFLAADPRFRGYSFMGTTYSFRVYRNPKCW